MLWVVATLRTRGPPLMFVCLAAALVITEVNHLKVLLADDVVCSHWVHDKLVATSRSLILGWHRLVHRG